MNLEAILNTSKAPGHSRPGAAYSSRMNRRAGVVKFETPVLLEPGPITEREIARIRAAKKCGKPKTKALEGLEIAGYQMVRDLICKGLDRVQIIQKCASVRGLGEHNANTIRRALLYR